MNTFCEQIHITNQPTNQKMNDYYDPVSDKAFEFVDKFSVSKTMSSIGKYGLYLTFWWHPFAIMIFDDGVSMHKKRKKEILIGSAKYQILKEKYKQENKKSVCDKKHICGLGGLSFSN